MKTYSLFDAHTGLFAGRTFATNEAEERLHAAAVAANTPAGHDAVEGVHDHLSRRVDVEKVAAAREAHLAAHAATVATLREKLAPSMMPGHPAEFREPPAPPFFATAAQVIDYVPPQPTEDHEWDPASKRWQLSAAAQAKAVAAAAARARHAELIVSQHDDMRRAMLGDAAAMERLRAIEAQVEMLLTLGTS